jgi:hypothetical protein
MDVPLFHAWSVAGATHQSTYHGRSYDKVHVVVTASKCCIDHSYIGTDAGTYVSHICLLPTTFQPVTHPCLLYIWLPQTLQLGHARSLHHTCSTLDRCAIQPAIHFRFRSVTRMHVLRPKQSGMDAGTLPRSRNAQQTLLSANTHAIAHQQHHQGAAYAAMTLTRWGRCRCHHGRIWRGMLRPSELVWC